ncbi:energy transducer TonB, partial [Arthrospira sp. PCC 8006]
MTATTSAISYIPSLVRQPTTVAVLASLGLHALFALNLENIRLYPNTVQLPPSVELVELSPSQIDQVFPAPPPQFSFTPFAEPPSLPMWGSAPTPSPFPPSAQQLPVFPSTLPQPRDNPFSAAPSRPPQIFNNPSNSTFLPPVQTSSPPPAQFSPPPPIEFYQTPPGQPSFPGNQ